jgi:hypothetical protein
MAVFLPPLLPTARQNKSAAQDRKPPAARKDHLPKRAWDNRTAKQTAPPTPRRSSVSNHVLCA